MESMHWKPSPSGRWLSPHGLEKLSPIFGEGGPRQWWVRGWIRWEKGEICRNPLIRLSATFSLREKAKHLYWFAHFDKYIFINKINALKTLARWQIVESALLWKTLARFGRGGTASVVGEGMLWTENMRKLREWNESLIRSAATFSPKEKATCNGWDQGQVAPSLRGPSFLKRSQTSVLSSARL